MVFSSPAFLFAFLPVCFILYRLLPNLRSKNALLTLASVVFYAFGEPVYVLLLLMSVIVNYLCGYFIVLRRPRKKLVLALAVVINLGFLSVFKYTDFAVSTVNHAFGLDLALPGIALPVGISFFTFQGLSYVIDVYRDETLVSRDFLKLALYISFFPQLIAGPIVNHSEMLPQFHSLGKKPVQWEKIAGGFGLFILGLAKKVLLADTFGAGVDFGYAGLSALGRADAVVVILSYALQLYFDFSGYCDMARGIGRMLGIEIPVNFDSPYKAVNIIDFWKRWHITLNRFFTKYVYIPLGGNRRGPARMYLNLLVVFLLSGLWHGAGWHYLVWGAMHGVLYVATRFWQKYRAGRGGMRREAKHRFMTIVSQISVFLYVAVAWVYFRAESVAQANRMLITAIRGPVQKLSMELADCFRLDEFWYVLKVLHLDNMAYSRYILMWLLLAAGLYLSMVGKNAAGRVERLRFGAGSAVVLAVLTLWCVLTFSEVSTFLYFNF